MFNSNIALLLVWQLSQLYIHLHFDIRCIIRGGVERAHCRRDGREKARCHHVRQSHDLVRKLRK